MSKKSVNAFIEKLKSSQKFREEFGLEFATVEEGDWSRVIKLAKGYGFTFTKRELLDVIPEGFYRGKGKKPDLGWEK